MSRAHPDGPSTEPLTTFLAWPAARSAATARVRLALGTARRPERRRRRTALGQRHVQLLERPRHLRATRFPHITPRRTHRARTHNNPGLGAARRGHAHARQVKRHALVGSAFTFPTGVASRPVGRLWTAPCVDIRKDLSDHPNIMRCRLSRIMSSSRASQVHTIEQANILFLPVRAMVNQAGEP